MWSGIGPYDVPIHARRDGFLIFEFDKTPTYKGGEVPSHIAEGGKPIPAVITAARESRTVLAYQRLQYMNAFLAGLYSGWSTVQKTATPVQAPIDPTSYFGAVSVNGEWKLHNNGNKVDYPAARGILTAISRMRLRSGARSGRRDL